MKCLVFWFEFYWSLFLRFQLTISHHWFRAPNKRQTITWSNDDPFHWHIHVALGGDKSTHLGLVLLMYVCILVAKNSSPVMHIYITTPFTSHIALGVYWWCQYKLGSGTYHTYVIVWHIMFHIMPQLHYYLYSKFTNPANFVYFFKWFDMGVITSKCILGCCKYFVSMQSRKRLNTLRLRQNCRHFTDIFKAFLEWECMNFT